MSSQATVQSTVPPFNSGYSTEVDVAAKFGGASTLFTTSTVPTLAQVRDIIVMGDSWIDDVMGHDFRLHSVTETYDAIGQGRRAGKIQLRNYPVISVERVEYRVEGGSTNSRDAWIPGVQGSGGDAAGVTVSSGPLSAGADAYFVYPEKGEIWWNRIRFNLPQKFRVTYNYGYPSVPDKIRDLSRTKAALECLTSFGGSFIPAENVQNYRLSLELDLQRLITSAGHRPLAGSA